MAADQQKWIHRMLVMLDIRDLALIPNPKSYLAAIQHTVHKFLASCDPRTLWAFKLFDSSLSSYRSRSAIERDIGKWAAHVSFDSVHQVQTFASALKCLANLEGSANLASLAKPGGGSVVESVAQAMQELVHDYCWEPPIFDDVSSSGKQNLFANGNSNLVVLFSCADFSPLIDGDLSDFFTAKFKFVNESFKSRDIHFCWVDVPPLVSKLSSNEIICRETVRQAFAKMGWSFTSVDTLILAANIVPFPLIWPSIAYPRVCPAQCSAYAEVDLELEDVDGKALVCKACEVQWTDLSQSKGLDLSCCIAGMDFSVMLHKNVERSLGSSGSHMKIHVVLPIPKEKCQHLSNSVSRRVLLSGFKGRKKKCKMENSYENIEDGGNAVKDEVDRDLIGDEVLSRLRQQSGEFRLGKPAWQLLLVFLSHRSLMTLVNVSDENGHSFGAILEPLTVHTAILHILGTNFLFTTKMLTGVDCHVHICTKALESKAQANPNIDAQFSGNSHELEGVSDMKVDLAHGKIMSHEQELVPSSLNCNGPKKPVSSHGQKASREHKSLKRCPDLQCNTWDSFYSAIVGGLCKAGFRAVLPAKLEDRYFKGNCRQSKILRFLSRWMKKMSKKLDSGQAFEIISDRLQLNSHLVEESKSALETVQPVSRQEQYYPLSTELLSISNASLSTEVGDCDSAPVEVHYAEAFIESLDGKIQHGLSSKEVDLKAFAKRLVDVFVQLAETQLEAEHCSSTLVEKPRNLTVPPIYHEVTRLILKKPKDLANKYKDCLLPLSSEQLGNSVGSSAHTSEDKVREHELQILFRMEILASKVAETVEEHAKDKLIKEICTLLENVQFNLPGGIFDGESLKEFADRVVASRYNNCLNKVIKKIYKDMEFYAHDESGDMLNSMSNQDKDSEMHRKEDDTEASSQNEFMGTNSGEGGNVDELRQMHYQISTAADDSHSQKLPEDHDAAKNHLETCLKGDDYQRRLKKAEAKRERARRFAHFTSRARDLQRVWAPKQPSHIIKKQYKSHTSRLKKKHVKADESDVIFETPMPFSKIKKYKDGKTVLAEKEIKTMDVVRETPYTTKAKDYMLGGTSDIVHETPYPIRKVHNHVSGVRTMMVDYSHLRAASEHVTSGTESKLGSISRALFEKGKAL